MLDMRFDLTTADVAPRHGPGSGRSPLSSGAYRQTLEAAGVSRTDIEALRELAEMNVDVVVPPPDSLPTCRLIV
jgi:hypothetical protein